MNILTLICKVSMLSVIFIAGCSKLGPAVPNHQESEPHGGLINLIEQSDDLDKAVADTLIRRIQDADVIDSSSSYSRNALIAIRPRMDIAIGDVSSFPLILVWEAKSPSRAIEVQLRESLDLESRFSSGLTVLVEDQYAVGSNGLHVAMLYATSSGLDLSWRYDGKDIPRVASVVRFRSFADIGSVCISGRAGQSCTKIIASSDLFDAVSDEFIRTE